MPHQCVSEKWECPVCKKENQKYISHSTVTTCDQCKESLSWNGQIVVRYAEWLNA